MKTKLRFLFVLLTMLWWGANFSFGETTHELRIGESGNTAAHEKLNTGEFTTPTSWFTVAGSTSSKYSGMYLGTSYTEGLKMDSKGKISFETSKTSNITIVQCTKQNDNDWTNGIRVKVGGTTTTYQYNDAIVTTPSDENNRQVRVYTLTGQTANTFEITGNSESGIFYVKVVEYEYSYPDATVKSYPHTWDFTASSSDWGSTSAQVVSYDDWNAGSDNNPCTYYVTGTAEETRGFNIDVLKGLRCQSYYLGVDWGYGHIYVTAGSITIPSVPAGYRIIFTMEGRETGRATNMTTSQATPVERSVSSTDTKHTTYTFDVSSAGDVTFNFDGAISVKSIKVTSNTYTSSYTATMSDSEIDGNYRPLAGTFEFTGEGAVADGTVISDVPGITATIAKGSSDLNVTTRTDGDQYYYKGYILKSSTWTETGATITFTPYVNGFLSLQGNFFNESKLVNTSDNTNVWGPSDGATKYKDMTDISTPLQAGVTYQLQAGSYSAFELHAFKFRPAFLEVDQATGNLYTLDGDNRIYTEASKDISNPYKSDLSKDPTRFPRLIQSANNYVKFADKPVDSEIEHFVNIATNNDVTLLENGKTLMKGTVSCAIPNRDLFTYYYLQSNILKLEKTYRQKGEGSVTEIADQEYVNQSDIANGGYYQFEFSGTISPVSGSKPAVYFKRIGTDSGEWDLRNYQGGANLSISGTKVLVKFDDLEEGTTVKLRIPSSSVMLTDDNNARNPEIIRYFTIKKENEPEVKLIYPTSVASVATSIVVEAKRSDNQNQGVDDNYTVKGVLKGPGISGSGMEITAFFDNNNIVFKPTSALNPNSTYTLEIEENQIFMKGTPEQKVTKKKEFMFTTGASSGEVPTVIAKTPNDGVEVSVGDGTISFTFDQDVTIEPYSRVAAIPINGSESTCDAMSRDKDSESSWLLKKLIDGNDRVVGFTYGSDGLKYDMYYEVVLHANTVTGSGGKANERTTIRFKVKPASGYYSGDLDNYNFRTKEGYPYTWDFSVMEKAAKDEIKTSWTAVDATTPPKSYKRSDQSNCYGKELSASLSTYIIMNDLRGLRITQTKENTNGHIRFLEIDDDSKRCLRLHGNTNYMCIPNVPASVDDANGEHLLYIDANLSNNGVFALNCPSEMAEWVGDAPKGTDGRKVYKIRIKKNAETADGFAAYSETLGRDIPLVCSDVNIYKIAYSTYNKTLTLGGEGYATDAHNYNISENGQTSNIASTAPKGVDYAMTATLAGQMVTPYYVTAVSGGDDKNTPGTITLTQVSDGVAPGQGTVLIGKPGATFPIFAKAYSKANSETSANLLSSVVTSGSVTLNQQSESGDNYYYYYVLNNQPIKVADDEGETQIGSSSGMGFYLVHKSTSIPMQAHSAYLIFDRKLNQGGGVATSSGAREVYFFKFEDENGNDLTGISTMEADGIKDNSTNGDGLYYDLHGQRHVYPTKPGLYIHNGKKVYLK